MTLSQGDMDVSPMSPNPSGTVRGEPPPEAVASAYAEIPSEEEVLTEGKAYPGNLAIGAPAMMPETWCRGWYAGKLGYQKFAWERWRKIFKLDFENDFRGGRTQALGDLKKNAPGGNGSMGKSELREALRVARHLKDDAEEARLFARLEGME
jgi:hypothetical protein